MLSTEREFRLNPDGTAEVRRRGRAAAAALAAEAIYASDIVSTGDAVDGLLSRMGGTTENLAGLPNGVVFVAAAALDKQFAGKDRAFVEVALPAASSAATSIDATVGPGRR